jgi:hypothetical protein
VVGKPDAMVIAFGSDSVDIFEVNDLMSSKGWHLNALQRPNRYKVHFQPIMSVLDSMFVIQLYFIFFFFIAMLV